MLDRLKMKPSRVRDLPMFLHAQAIVIPELVDGKNMFITCPLPLFFKRAIKILNLDKSSNRLDIKYENLVNLSWNVGFINF